MTQDTAAADVLRNLLPELEEEGYEVFLLPQPPILPPFLSNFRPDAIARRRDKHIVIEIVRSLSNDRKLQELARLVRENPGWELRVILAKPTTTTAIERQPIEAIRRTIDEIKKLTRTEHYAAALIMSWATFEALGRLLMFDEFQKPQSPGRLVQVLAQEGYLTPSEADRLRALTEKRNSLVHGRLQTQITKPDVEQFLVLLERLTNVQLSS
jgi:uncharacterized protein YutE (UPF0331/DUF86 family)